MLEGGCAWSVVLTGEQLNSASGAGETPWATPVVGLIAGEERRRESRERLVEVGKAALNVEMWQENPAKAASMVTGDVAMALVPGGAEAKGVLTVASSGQAVFAVGKAGKVSQKFGVPKAGAGASVAGGRSIASVRLPEGSGGPGYSASGTGAGGDGPAGGGGDGGVPGPRFVLTGNGARARRGPSRLCQVTL